MNQKHGKTYWFDLPVSNMTDAMAFYEGLLGWKFSRMDGSNDPNYMMIQVDNELIGGLRQIKTPAPRSEGPIIYFHVREMAPAVNRLKELGGKCVGDQVDLGKKRGVYQWFHDREKNLVALWAPQ